MTMRIAFQMDPMEEVDINADTTFALAEEASFRGYELYEYSPEHLIYNEGLVQARARKCI
jgi:glutathione synthase